MQLSFIIFRLCWKIIPNHAECKKRCDGKGIQGIGNKAIKKMFDRKDMVVANVPPTAGMLLYMYVTIYCTKYMRSNDINYDVYCIVHSQEPFILFSTFCCASTTCTSTCITSKTMLQNMWPNIWKSIKMFWTVHKTKNNDWIILICIYVNILLVV